jgi:hypothetical protein
MRAAFVQDRTHSINASLQEFGHAGHSPYSRRRKASKGPVATAIDKAAHRLGASATEPDSGSAGKEHALLSHPVILAAIDPIQAFAKPTQLDGDILAAGNSIKSALRGTLHALHAHVPLPAGANHSGEST